MGAEYKAAISRTGGAALGALQSTHLCIVATKSTLTPARALLDHRQARSDYWPDPRGKGAGDPQAAVRVDGQNQGRGGAEVEEEVEKQGREHLRALPGDLLVYDEDGALAAAKGPTGRMGPSWTMGALGRRRCMVGEGPQPWGLEGGKRGQGLPTAISPHS